MYEYLVKPVTFILNEAHWCREGVKPDAFGVYRKEAGSLYHEHVADFADEADAMEYAQWKENKDNGAYSFTLAKEQIIELAACGEDAVQEAVDALDEALYPFAVQVLEGL